MTAVAAATNAPTGSLYHRFASRDELLAEAWIRAMGSFQEGFLRALTVASRPPGLAASLFPIEWARGNLSAARILVLHRRQEFMAGELPTPLRETAATQASDLDRAIAGFAMSAWGDSGLAAKDRALFLTLDLPNAAMRRYLAAGIAPPTAVDALVAEAVSALSTAAGGPD
jgi:AcrR family transcriptional regulator